MSGSKSPTNAPSTAARAAAARSRPPCSGNANVTWRILRGLAKRTATPAALRISDSENFAAFPTPTINSRLAFSSAGACSSRVSQAVAENSPLFNAGLSAPMTVGSFVSRTGSAAAFLSFDVEASADSTTSNSASRDCSASNFSSVFIWNLCSFQIFGR